MCDAICHLLSLHWSSNGNSEVSWCVIPYVRNAQQKWHSSPAILEKWFTTIIPIPFRLSKNGWQLIIQKWLTNWENHHASRIPSRLKLHGIPQALFGNGTDPNTQMLLGKGCHIWTFPPWNFWGASCFSLPFLP